jgi:sugar phosphate isomerase/epimerase
MTKSLWAMAAGCVPDSLPWDIPRIASAAGFLSSGMWVDPETTWDSDALRKTKLSLSDTGIQLVDVEVARLNKTELADDTHKLIIEVGLELGARNVLVISKHEDYLSSISQFRDMCEMAGEEIRICLEFGEFTNIKSLKEAQNFVDAVDHPAAGILIDLMHLNRSGDDLPDLDAPIFPYIQGCDFWQSSANMTGKNYIEAAVDSRCCLGEGEARMEDITKVCGSDKDVSLEIRSSSLRKRFPDPYLRAETIFNICNRTVFST